LDIPAQPANIELLSRALQRQAPAVLTCGEGLARREVMVEFSAASHDSDCPGFFATFHEADALFIDETIGRAACVGFWFQEHDSMILFESTILKKRRRTLGQNLLLAAWPGQITVVEERQQPRRLVPESAKISARIQILSPSREIEYETTARIWDLGRDGASIICESEPTLITLPKDSWLNIIINVRDDHQFTLTASFRHMRRLPQDKLRIGLQFLPSGDPSAASATAALHALVKELQQSPGGNAINLPPSAVA